MRPFSGPKYAENAARAASGATPCAHCGEGIEEPWPFTVRVIDGGSAYASEAQFNEYEPIDPAGDLGDRPVGDCCEHLIRSSGVYLPRH